MLHWNWLKSQCTFWPVEFAENSAMRKTMTLVKRRRVVARADRSRSAWLSLGFCALPVFCLFLCSTAAYAQDPSVLDSNALQLPDRSSPRDSIAGFLSDMDVVADAIVGGQLETGDADNEFKRALSAMDFSTTPHGSTWLVRSERALMLVDILERTALPPLAEIPGDEDVARDSLEEWVIPGTPIHMRRIVRRGRGSEFVFAAESVERLDRYHRATRDLPSTRKSPPLVGIWLADETADFTKSRIVRSRLKRTDTGSPRSTLVGFMDSVNRAYVIVREADAALSADPPTLTRAEALEAERLALDYLRRAASTLDLSNVAPANREDVGLETVLQLKEIMDRLILPPIDSIPGELRVREFAEAGKSTSWLYPNTEIEIVQLEEGENQGRFLFSSKSIDLIPAAYERVRDLPYRSDVWRAIDVDYFSPGISPGFYRDYTLTPGYLVPGATPLGRLVDAFPDWTGREIATQTIWQWAFLVITALIATAAILLTFTLTRRATRQLKDPLHSWLSIAAPVIGAVFIVQAVDFVDTAVNITGTALTATRALGGVFTTALVVWAVVRLAVAIAESIVASPSVPEVGINANLIRIGTRLVAFVVGAWIVVADIQSLGFDLLPLIAGLGVGGLAVALAAQRTFANMLGGIILYLNKPVRVGDFCLYSGDQMGTVEEIGLLSTRIRTRERSIVTIPNADFSEYPIENLSIRDKRRFNVVLGLRYETSPRQLRYVIARLREFLDSHRKVEPEPRVRFRDLAAYSFDVEINAYLSCTDHSDYLAIREDLLMRIVDLVAEAGTEFAFPSAVHYGTEASEMDADLTRAAEERVEQWWADGNLARPGFEESRPGQSDSTTGYLEDSSAPATESKADPAR